MNKLTIPSELQTAVFLLEHELSLGKKSVEECIQEIVDKNRVSEDVLRRQFALINQTSPEDFYLSEHPDRSKILSMDEIRRQLDEELEENGVNLNWSIFDVENPHNLPFSPVITEDENKNIQAKLELAVNWLRNVIEVSDVDIDTAVDRLSLAFGLDEGDLKIEFEVHNNMTPYAYKRVWGHSSAWSASEGEGSLREVFNDGHGRTRYVYGNSSKTSTTYYRSKWEEQAAAWEKLENMVQISKKTEIEN